MMEWCSNWVKEPLEKSTQQKFGEWGAVDTTTLGDRKSGRIVESERFCLPWYLSVVAFSDYTVSLFRFPSTVLTCLQILCLFPLLLAWKDITVKSVWGQWLLNCIYPVVNRYSYPQTLYNSDQTSNWSVNWAIIKVHNGCQWGCLYACFVICNWSLVVKKMCFLLI